LIFSVQCPTTTVSRLQRSLWESGCSTIAGFHEMDRYPARAANDRRQAFTHGRGVAEGVGGAGGDQNVPIIVNRAWGSGFLLDRRAATLEEQALQRIFNPKELGMTPETMLELLQSSRYRSEFLTTFGDEPSRENASRALASYMRTILSGDSPYDRRVLSEPAQRGLALFHGKAGCNACHAGPKFRGRGSRNGPEWTTSGCL
jgi:cytochrome c peroxidase